MFLDTISNHREIEIISPAGSPIYLKTPLSLWTTEGSDPSGGLVARRFSTHDWSSTATKHSNPRSPTLKLFAQNSQNTPLPN